MKTLKSLLGLCILGSALYAAWLVFPVYFANYQLEDAMDSAARFGYMDRSKTDQDIRDSVLKEARSLNIPIQPEQIQVQRTGTELLVWGDYTVHVDMPVHPFDLHFQPASKNKKRSM